MEPVRPSFGVNISPVLFLSSGSAWSLSIDKTIEFYSQQIFLSSGSAWSLSKQGIFSSAMGFNFYPQAPHGACQNKVSFQVPWDLISILRLRMEPVSVTSNTQPSPRNFYPQAPHGACPFVYSKMFSLVHYFYPQAPHGACLP